MDNKLEERLNVYRTKKSAEYIIYDCYDKKYNSAVFNIDFMNLVKEFIKYLAGDEAIIKPIENNIFDYLSAAREIKDEHRDERIDIINDITRIVNSSLKNNYRDVYREELAIRRGDINYLDKYPDYIIEQEIDNIHLSMTYDYFVLFTHSNKISDEDFITIYLSKLINRSLYYESINNIFYEEPLMFKDLTFYNRMICVFNMNNELNNTDKSVTKRNKKLVKRINKIIKENL